MPKKVKSQEVRELLTTSTSNTHILLYDFNWSADFKIWKRGRELIRARKAGGEHENKSQQFAEGVDAEMALTKVPRPSIPHVSRTWTLDESVQAVNYVRSYGKPNIYGARVPIPTVWNLDLMYQLAE